MQNAAWLCCPALSRSDWVVLWKFAFTKKTKWGWVWHAWHLLNLPWITDSLACFVCVHNSMKEKTMSLAVLSQGLFSLTCSHFTNAVCHLCMSALIFDPSYSQWRRWRLKCSNAQLCSSPQEGLVSLHGATDLLNPKRFDIITVSQLYLMLACVMRDCPSI